MQMSISVKNAQGTVLAHREACDLVDLVYKDAYRQGDCIHLACSVPDTFLVIRLEDAMAPALVYLASEFAFPIPFGEGRSTYSPKTFVGDIHLLSARIASAEEISAYRNMALNGYDHHGNNSCFPHVSANVETRGEAAFAARNAIDGITANDDHGAWPYGSWGINRRDDAEITVEFGRVVEVDKLIIFLRADFPHDNYWERADVIFSDGSEITVELVKTEAGQEFLLDKSKRIKWLKMLNLIKSDDPSPFPALTQLEVYGREVCE